MVVSRGRRRVRSRPWFARPATPPHPPEAAMIPSRSLFVLAAVVSLTLVGAAPPHQLAPCLNSDFRGITQTLPDGTIVGEPDPSDWGCVGHGNGAAGSAAGRAGATRARSAEAEPGAFGVPVPPPS